ncbi:MAG: hypothetical protein JSS55_03285 [Proteobacteria bacterium]|nr:hypothetical protein [Pseudomonadota bacterium]
MARIIADVFLFLDQTGDDILDPDVAVEMMEWLAHRLDELDRGFLRELVDAFPVIAPEFGESEQSVRDIPSDLFLEETLAEGDPVRLAELEAIRDAKA